MADWLVTLVYFIIGIIIYYFVKNMRESAKADDKVFLKKRAKSKEKYLFDFKKLKK